MKYISDGTWYDKGTECELLFKITDFVDGTWSGLFRGIRNGGIDEEVCLSDEFILETL